MTRLPPEPHSEPYTPRDRLIDAVVGLLCWMALTWLAVALHAAASANLR